MTKSKVDTSAAERHLAKIAENNARVRATAPKHMLSVMDQVQSAIDDENADMANRLEAENQLREWAQRLCGVALDISEIENLKAQVEKIKPGQVLTFLPGRPKSKEEGRVLITLYKTAFGTVDRLDNYIFALEKTIVDLSNKTVPKSTSFETPKQEYTDYKFFDLIKLAFSRLITRRK